MTARCPRGHFIPATAPTDTCHCTPSPRRRARIRGYSTYDLLGQHATADALRTATTIRPAGSYL